MIFATAADPFLHLMFAYTYIYMYIYIAISAMLALYSVV